MSGFTGEGFTPFPNTYQDNLDIARVSELGIEALEYRVNEYGAFLQRTDIMRRARETGNRVLDHLLFELGYRDGIYVTKLEDETCDAA